MAQNKSSSLIDDTLRNLTTLSLIFIMSQVRIYLSACPHVKKQALNCSKAQPTPVQIGVNQHQVAVTLRNVTYILLLTVVVPPLLAPYPCVCRSWKLVAAQLTLLTLTLVGALQTKVLTMAAINTWNPFQIAMARATTAQYR